MAIAPKGRILDANAAAIAEKRKVPRRVIEIRNMIDAENTNFFELRLSAGRQKAIFPNENGTVSALQVERCISDVEKKKIRIVRGSEKKRIYCSFELITSCSRLDVLAAASFEIPIPERRSLL